MIRLLIVLFCFLAFSQDEKRGYLGQKVYTSEEVSNELNGNDFLILNGPGNYFNVLTRFGYFLGNLETKTFYFNKYKTPLPKELLAGNTTNLQSLVPLAASSESQRTQFNQRKAYLLYPGGGILYEFYNGSIIRIDSSFAQRNQYAGAFFSYNNQLYLLGGYGFWTTKSILTKFNFNSGDWEYIKTSGTAPKGINNPVFILKNNVLHLFNFNERPQNQSPIKNQNLYSLNMETLTWEKGGLINPFFMDEKDSSGDRFFNIAGKTIVNKAESPVIFEIDIDNNKIKKYADNLLLYKSGGKSIIKNNVIVSSVRNTSNNTSALAYYDLKALDKDIISEEYFIRGSISFVNYLVGAGILLAILLYLSRLSALRENKSYFVKGNTLFNSLNQINLDPDETKVLLLFTKKDLVPNKEILYLFEEKGKTKDFATKRKNKSISNLNKKFKLVFRENLVLKEKDGADSRLTNYLLNSKIDLLIK